MADFTAAGCDIEDKADLKDYLGVNVQQISGNRFKLSRPHLVSSIVKDVKLSLKATPRPMLSASTKILQRNAAEPLFDETAFCYRAVMGKLNFLEKSSRPDIAYATHQCARFSEEPRVLHG